MTWVMVVHLEEVGLMVSLWEVVGQLQQMLLL